MECSNCKWYDVYNGVCCNDKSERCCDFLDDECYCDDWEGESNE